MYSRMASIDFFPTDITHTTTSGTPAIQLFGRTHNGKKICVIDDQFHSYFWVIPEDSSKIRTLVKKIEALKITDKDRLIYATKTEVHQKVYLGENIEAIKVSLNDHRGIQALRHEIRTLPGVISAKEADISYEKKYLVEKEIIPLLSTAVEGEPVPIKNLNVDIALKPQTITQKTDVFVKDPKILSFDIEVYNKTRYPDEEVDPVLMVAFSGSDGFSKVITWKTFKDPKKYIEFVKNEEALIYRFKEIIQEYKPDYLVGYFSDGFDLPYMRERADKHNIPLDLGLDNSTVRLRKTRGSVTARITGIPHVDIYKFIRRVMSNTLDIDSYDLDTVGKALLGEGKTQGAPIEDLHHAWDHEPERLKDYCEYNLQDAKITLRLLNVMLPNLNEMVKLVGQPIYDVCRMTFGQLVEWYLIKHAKEANQIVPNRPLYTERAKRSTQSYEGAFVFQPEPGLYSDVVVFDFRSLYPSIVSAHNIDPGTLTTEAKDAHKTPDILVNKKNIYYYFNYKKEGFIPNVLKDVILRRNRIKEMMKKKGGGKANPLLHARQDSLKILSNSFYGYFAFAGSRWYSNECAAAITAYGRHYIKTIIDKAQRAKFKTIYSDTDSIFIALGKKSRPDVMKFLRDVNMELPSLMELEFEGFYPKGIFVMKKGEARGAKKKYALIDENNQIKVTGFETVRGDWSTIAKEAQNNVLEIVLKDNDAKKATTYIKTIINDIKNKKVPLEKMVIKKQLKKDILDYESIGPHVAVAKKLQEQGISVSAGTMIKFVIDEGKGTIGERAKHVDECTGYDADYYINNQVIPAVAPIFEVLGVQKEQLMDVEQSKLGEF